VGWGIPRGACKQPPAKRIRWGGGGGGGVEPPKITKNRSFIRYAVFLFHTSLKGFEICQEAPTRNNLPICKNLPIQTLPIQTLSGVGGVGWGGWGGPKTLYECEALPRFGPNTHLDFSGALTSDDENMQHRVRTWDQAPATSNLSRHRLHKLANWAALLPGSWS